MLPRSLAGNRLMESSIPLIGGCIHRVDSRGLSHSPRPMLSAKEVLEYWHELNLSPLDSIKESIAQLAADIVNIYGKSFPNVDITDVMNGLESSKLPRVDAKGFRDALCDGLNIELNCSTPPEIANLSVDTGPIIPKAPAPPRPPSPEFLKLREMRNMGNRVRGVRLAKAAQRMQGWFHWIPRGPAEVSPLESSTYVPKEFARSGGQMFWQWLSARGMPAPEPGQETVMNCWESVIFSAYKANLITLGQIRPIYEAALMAARKVLEPSLHAIHRAPSSKVGEYAHVINLAFDRYVHELDFRLLHSRNAVPLRPQEGLVPQAGDLVFLNNGPQGHVAIALGRHKIEGEVVHQVMSLWTHHGGRFAKLGISELGYTSNLSFCPCPF